MVSLISISLPDNQDFVFYPTSQANLILYSYIMDYETLKILVRNVSNQSFYVLCRYKLGHQMDMAYKNYFFMDIQFAYNAVAVPPSLYSFFNVSTGPTLSSTDSLIETVLKNVIKVYKYASAVKQISDLVVEYLSI